MDYARIQSYLNKSRGFSENERNSSRKPNNDPINEGLYSVRFKSELEQLRNQSSDKTMDISRLFCLPYISAAHQLETINSQSFHLVDRLEEQESALRSEWGEKTNLNKELTELNQLLQTRLDSLQTSNTTHKPETAVKELEEKNSTVVKENKHLLGQLKSLLNHQVLDAIVDEENGDDTDRQEIRTELRRTVENLLNEMFNPSSTGYIHMSNMDSPIAHFLLSNDLITIHPEQPDQIRLRDFGK